MLGGTMLGMGMGVGFRGSDGGVGLAWWRVGSERERLPGNCAVLGPGLVHCWTDVLIWKPNEATRWARRAIKPVNNR